MQATIITVASTRVFVNGCISNTYQSLPDPVPGLRNDLVLLVWSSGGLPSLTTGHMHSGLDFGLVAPAFTNRYHGIPSFPSESGRRSEAFTISTSAGMDRIKYSHNEEAELG